MYGSIREEFLNAYQYHRMILGRLSRIESVCRDFGLLGYPGYLIYDSYSETPSLTLSPSQIPWGRYVEDTTLEEELSGAIKFLLSKVGKLDKSFDNVTNQLKFTGMYNGVQIILASAPPSTCKVEKFEEEYTIPATPEHTGTRTTYKLVGDCEPFTKTSETGANMNESGPVDGPDGVAYA